MFWLNAVLIPSPTECASSTEMIERVARTASGRMVAEVVAIKLVIQLRYDLLSASELHALRSRLAARVFHTLRYPDPPDERTIIIKYKGISYSLWRRVDGERYFQDVNIEVIEQ
ncbi:MAG: hypothetical protein DDT19_01620 [Syntrophomonadaceae bacterium]|nr:hypothetical protein [Bacillota bacterium]